VGSDVQAAADRAIEREVEDVNSSVAEVDSESTLQDHIKALRRFAPRVGISEERLQKAIAVIESRIAEINDEVDVADAPQVSGKAPRAVDKFDDAALSNLFAPLIAD
jgi:phage shock protein A